MKENLSFYNFYFFFLIKKQNYIYNLYLIYLFYKYFSIYCSNILHFSRQKLFDFIHLFRVIAQFHREYFQEHYKRL